MNTKHEKIEIPAKLAREAKRLGVDPVWLAKRILEREAEKISGAALVIAS